MLVTDNLILKSPTPPSFGFVQFTDVNIGKMENKGFEFEASYNQRTTPFKWGITGNVSVVRNKVLRLDAPNGVIYGGEGNYFSSWGYAVTRTAAGEPIQDYARRRLFEPLGMKKTRLHLDEMKHAWTYADMETTPRDFARIGLLMLRKGMWQDQENRE